jgi:hypothetical protein
LPLSSSVVGHPPFDRFLDAVELADLVEGRLFAIGEPVVA